jgi:hypothetical protein
VKSEAHRKGSERPGVVELSPSLFSPNQTCTFQHRGGSGWLDSLGACPTNCLSRDCRRPSSQLIWFSHRVECVRVTGSPNPSRHSGRVVPCCPSQGRAFANFKKLWARHIRLHSSATWSSPRNSICRNPRACLICPKTGSTVCLRN